MITLDWLKDNFDSLDLNEWEYEFLSDVLIRYESLNENEKPNFSKKQFAKIVEIYERESDRV